MWSSGFSFGLRVKRHWCLTAGTVAVFLAACFAIWFSSLPMVCAMPLGGIACLQGWRALFASAPEISIRVDLAGRIRTLGGGGPELRLAGRPWILPGVAVGFRLVDPDGGVLPIILLRSQLSGETWRRLLVRIREN
jgi:hypothetical protein